MEGFAIREGHNPQNALIDLALQANTPPMPDPPIGLMQHPDRLAEDFAAHRDRQIGPFAQHLLLEIARDRQYLTPNRAS